MRTTSSGPSLASGSGQVRRRSPPHFRTSTGAIPYSLKYGMEVVLPVEIKMGSSRVAL